uniref:MAM domain-containing glycosylphosphatidylinositol anchor protein 1-like n=1 Tax=Diabrotica virgifera virgifera TaxID=50390 RepID=A0A6P7GJ83_DIAVI
MSRVKDGTFTTISSLSFKASHWENGRTIHCFAENAVMSKNAEPELRSNLILDVRYPPVITVSPKYAVVNESTEQNTTSAFLNCVYFSNPQKLTSVAWAHPPGPARIRYAPSKVVKGGSVNLTCTVESSGRPDNVSYIWHRGSHVLTNVTQSVYTIPSARLETRNNFSCAAQNEGGKGAQASVFVNVYAAPAFTKKPKTYQGILYTSKHINLSCVVECYPECGIVWYKDGIKLDVKHNHLYTVETHFLPPNQQMNDFESINSTLIWNMTAWPGGMLNKTAPNTNYTCQATSNKIGVGITSTAEIAVDYPPEEVTTSDKTVNVKEGEAPATVKCYGKGRPALSFQWKRMDNAEVISTNDVLSLSKMSRSDKAAYMCEASNKHGLETAMVHFNVQDAPDCSITHADRDGTPSLVCTALANPPEMTFVWRVKEGNETFNETSNIIQDGAKSYLQLDSSVENPRTYYCIANNSIGFSNACHAEVAGSLSWWKDLNQDKWIIIISSIIAIVIFIIIICVIIIILCRRKRADTKYNSPLEMEEREKFLCTQSPDVLGLPLVPCGRLTYLGNQGGGFYLLASLINNLATIVGVATITDVVTRANVATIANVIVATTVDVTKTASVIAIALDKI